MIGSNQYLYLHVEPTYQSKARYPEVVSKDLKIIVCTVYDMSGLWRKNWVINFAISSSILPLYGTPNLVKICQVVCEEIGIEWKGENLLYKKAFCGDDLAIKIGEILYI